MHSPDESSQEQTTVLKNQGTTNRSLILNPGSTLGQGTLTCVMLEVEKHFVDDLRIFNELTFKKKKSMPLKSHVVLGKCYIGVCWFERIIVNLTLGQVPS